MSELLRIEGLFKSYAKSLNASMKYASFDILKGSIGISTEREKLRESEFWALHNISLSLHRGEVLGLLGHNGAGKSTLLKCIANKIQPTKGQIKLIGSLGHMIEMSAGFDASLTGRENVSLRGSILGFKGKALQIYIDKVREFADIDDFFDSPVQFYSSGMKSRLGFAASSSIEPDVLIIDEVLAVGDLSFRLKCYEQINQLAKKCAVIFVSHSIGQISKMCNRAIYLEKGRMIHDGDVKTALSIYQDKVDLSARKKQSATLNPELVSFSVEVNDNVVANESAKEILYGDKLSVTIDLSKFEGEILIRILLRESTGSVIQDWNSARSNLQWSQESKLLKADLGTIELSPGTYRIFIEVNSADGSEHLCLSDEIVFRVFGEYYSAVAIQKTAVWSFV